MINLYCSFMFRTKHLWLFSLLLLLLLLLCWAFCFNTCSPRPSPYLAAFRLLLSILCLKFLGFASESIRIESNRILFDVDVRFIL